MINTCVLSRFGRSCSPNEVTACLIAQRVGWSSRDGALGSRGIANSEVPDSAPFYKKWDRIKFAPQLHDLQWIDSKFGSSLYGFRKQSGNTT